MPQDLMESERDTMRGIALRPELMQRAREWVRDKFGGADRVPVAVAFRRNDAQLLEWRGPGMQCGPHHYWENCLNTCYQTANFSAGVVRYADSVIPTEHRSPQGKSQVFISVRKHTLLAALASLALEPALYSDCVLVLQLMTSGADKLEQDVQVR